MTPAEPWEAPLPFEERSVPPFPTSALPGCLRDFVEAEAEATQTPADLAAMVVLSTLAAACAKKVEILVKQGWVQPVNLFTLTVLPPGNRKSAVFRDCTEPLTAFEVAEATRMWPEILQAQARLRIAKEAK